MRPAISGKSCQLRMADGGVVTSEGCVTLPIEIQGCVFQQRMIVANVEAPVVLGYDFLHQNQSLLDIGKGEITIGGLQIKCLLESDLPSVFRITLTENVLVPPATEIIVSGEIVGETPLFSTALLESETSKLTDKGILMAKSIVDPSTGQIPLRLVNLFDKPTQLYKHMQVGVCEHVEVVDEWMSVSGTRDSEKRLNKISESSTAESPLLPEPIERLLHGCNDQLSPSQLTDVTQLLVKHKDVFSLSKYDIGTTNIVQHRINTGDAAPIKQPLRRLPLTLKGEVETEVGNMLENGIIIKSKSPWASPMVLVRKPDNSIRVCIDYRAVNAVTVKDSYPLPHINSSLDSLKGSRWFSTLDLASGYYQVELHPDDADKSAFVSTMGLFEFKKMSFGLCNAPATFERLMEYVLSGLQWETCLIYLDDIIIFSDTFENHLIRLNEVLVRIKDANLKVTPKKCHLFKKEVKFLGHVISEEGVATDPEKVKAVKTWPVPRDVHAVRSFIGTCCYYRRYILNFATIARPLHKLTEKTSPFVWTSECQDSFDRLKTALTTAPVLGYPNTTDPFILDSDASAFAIGAVLSQIQEGKERVIAYFSRTLNKSERDYCVTRKELLAVVDSIKQFHPYLYGLQFLVRSDHAALTWLLKFKNAEGQLARWLEVLGTYNFTIQHRPGKQHGNADGLSRRPCSPCRYCDRKETNESEYCRGESCRVTTRSRKQLDRTKQGSMNTRNDDDRVLTESEPASVGEHRPLPSSLGERSSSASTSGMESLACSPTIEGESSPRARDDTPKIDVNVSSQEGSKSGLTPPRPMKGASPDEVGKVCDQTVIEAQTSDPVISLLYDWKTEDRRPCWENISSMGTEIKQYWSQWDRIKLENGMLHREWHGDRTVTKQLIIPNALQPEILKMIHDDAVSGHLGIKRTLARLRNRFYWVNCDAAVAKWCNECQICQTRKGPAIKQKAPMKQYIVGAPLERVAIDIAGPFPETALGNKYILSMSDYFTRWVELCPMPNQEAVTVAQSFVSTFVSRYGVPRQIITDQGRQFESALFQELCHLLDIDKTRTSAFHPQSNGLIERFNRTMEDMISKYVATDQRDWDKYLPVLMMAYRSSVHDSTGQSPSMLMLGRELSLPVDILYGLHRLDPKSPCTYIEDLKDKMHHVHDLARNKMIKASDRQKRDYDHRSNHAQYQVGSPVWVFSASKKRGLCPKFQCKWLGPFVIKRKISDLVYEVRQGPKGKPKIVHYNRLKPHFGDLRS